jgi:sigma-B regulation protein RsbU (phosphoserine phosphatase)
MTESAASVAAEAPRIVDRGRLLVVDDNEDNRDMLSRRLVRRGYTVDVAPEGQAALDRIGSETYELVLLDVMMPGIDGFEVLERLRRTHPPDVLPVIMATARDRSDDIVRALELGANDYVTKPLDFAVVLARVRMQLTLHDARRQLAQANTRMRRDLDAGARIQRALIPQRLPATSTAQVAAKFEPCTELGGDLLDVFALPDGGLGLYLLDVSGHGVPAALTSVTLSRLLSHMGSESMVYEEGSNGVRPVAPAQLATALNRRFPMDPETNQYFTLVFAVLDPAARMLRYVAAGHPGPVHVPRDGSPRSCETSGPAIGWFPDARFEEHTIALSPGDRVYFYSDGIVEAQSPTGDFFGDDMFLATLTAARSGPLAASLDRVESEVRTWCGAAGPGDDVSILALEIAE